MKHLLNNLSETEKNRILEQYNNSLIVETKRFKDLMKSKLGDVRPLINEQTTIETDETIPNLDYFNKNKKGFLEIEKNNVIWSVNNEETDRSVINSDQLIPAGKYEYELKTIPTMRAREGEPVVQLMQNGKEMDYFYPKTK
jgi:hypothetical protein